MQQKNMCSTEKHQHITPLRQIWLRLHPGTGKQPQTLKWTSGGYTCNHILLSKYSGTRYKGKRTSVHSVRQWRKCQTQTRTPKNIHNLTIIKIIPARKQRINKFNKIAPLIVPKIGMLTTCLKQNQNEMIPKFLNISNQQLTRTATNIMTIPVNF